MRKASRLLSSMWDRQGRWFMPGLSLAALAKYGEGFDPVVVRRARSWAHERQNLDGGWSWCPEGQFLDTALTVGCLGDLAGQQVQTSISRAATWIRARRSPERGWGQHIAAPPDADDTGAAVLALVAAGSDGNDTDVCDALDFLCRSQNRNGSWGYPRHVGANLSEDTAAATAALMISSTQRHRSAAQRGIAWLLNHQQPDGSWATRWYVQPQIACWRVVRAFRAAGMNPDAGPLVGVRIFQAQLA
ncbi:MAG: prenyltransferase/squalene oxidase repeat-containing protein [Pauljensenia sp.]